MIRDRAKNKEIWGRENENKLRAKIRARITVLVQETQLGVLKGGYEIGVHAMCDLIGESRKNGSTPWTENLCYH